MTPAVRRLLREHGLAPEQIWGTGGHGAHHSRGRDRGGRGRAHRRHAGRAGRTSLATPALASAPGTRLVFPPGTDELLVPLTQMRKAIAAQMTRALQVPHAYVHVEVDVANLVRLRESLKLDYQAREGISLSFVPFVMKAVVEAVRRSPTFNATWSEQGLVAKRRMNVGVAVAVDDGLIVPVIRDVDQLSISGINRAIADVAARARAKKLRVDDFGGGTFTVDNTGWFGSNLTMPIINVPEVAILTMEAITKRPVVIETPQGDVIAIRPIMNMVIGIDHRANDGAQAGYFLRDIKAWLEGIGPTPPSSRRTCGRRPRLDEQRAAHERPGPAVDRRARGPPRPDAGARAGPVCHAPAQPPGGAGAAAPPARRPPRRGLASDPLDPVQGCRRRAGRVCRDPGRDPVAARGPRGHLGRAGRHGPVRRSPRGLPERRPDPRRGLPFVDPLRGEHDATGDKRPYVGRETPGFVQTPYTNGSMRLVLIENTPDGKARDTILIWLQDSLAGIEYARVPECSPG